MSNTLQILAATEKRLAQAVDTAQRFKSVAEAAEKRITELTAERDALQAACGHLDSMTDELQQTAQSGQVARAEKARADKAEAAVLAMVQRLESLGMEHYPLLKEQYVALRAALAGAGKGK